MAVTSEKQHTYSKSHPGFLNGGIVFEAICLLLQLLSYVWVVQGECKIMGRGRDAAQKLALSDCSLVFAIGQYRGASRKHFI